MNDKAENKDLEKFEPVDFSELLADYTNMWVVLSLDETHVLKAGKTYDDIIDFANRGISMFVPDFSFPYVP